MPLNYSSPFGRRLFAQIQSGGLLVANGSGGAWSATGAQYIRATEDSVRLSPNEPKVATNILHGSASSLARIAGRKSGTWEANVPLVPSGTQGNPPDVDPLLQSLFGGAGALASGTAFGNAWTYNIHNLQYVALTLLSFMHGQSATGNIFALGCIPQSMSIDFNGNILGASMRGVCVSAVPNEVFASIADPEPLGGLTSFPTEPGSITANGNIINGFKGVLKINGTVFSGMCDLFSIEFNTGQALKDNLVDSAYPQAVIFGGRSVTVQLGFVNNDSGALAQLKIWARLSTPVTVEFDLGTIAGQRMFVQVNGVQLVSETLNDQNGYVSCQFGQSASSVSTGLSNDLVLGFA